MTHIPAPSGIAGLTGREPIGAALTIGIKGTNGAPTEKDRFHVLLADTVQREYKRRDGESYKAPARDPHARFASFNSADPARRRAIDARLCHLTIAEMFEYRRQAQTANGIPAHPKRGPVCIGNGVDAQRWDGKDYQPIPCPGDLCKYAQAQGDKAPACKPWMRFLARFDWPRIDGKGLPNIPFKFTSGSWNTVKNFLGFFDAFRRACAGFGVEPDRIPLFGMPVTLTLAERTNPETQARFSVVSIQMAGDADLIEWIRFQLERLGEVRRLATARPVLALTDRESHTPEVLEADHQTISGPGLSVPQGK